MSPGEAKDFDCVKRGQRNAALDVLRCLLMFGVVLQHTFAMCKYGGEIAYSSYIVWDCLTHPSVDGFTSISGWFGVRCTLRKLYRLACLIFFCGCAHWLVYQLGQAICGKLFAAKFGLQMQDIPFRYECFRYWYLGAYIKLMLLTIVLNPAFDFLARIKKYWTVIVLLLVVGLSYLSTLWIPWPGHSPRTVIFIYIVIRLAQILGLKRAMQESRTFRVSAFCVLGALILFLVFDALCHKYGIAGWTKLGLRFGDYADPPIVLTGLFLVACFSVVKFSEKSRLVRLCSFIAPSMISVYMLHWNFTISFFKPIPQVLLGTFPNLPVVLAFLPCAIAIFAICVLMDVLRRRILDVLKKRCKWQVLF